MCSVGLVETVHALAMAQRPDLLHHLEARAAKFTDTLNPRQVVALVRGYRRASVPAPGLLAAASACATSRSRGSSEFSTKQVAQLLMAATREGAECSGGLRVALEKRLRSSAPCSLSPQLLRYIAGVYREAGGEDEAVLKAVRQKWGRLRSQGSQEQ